MTLPAIEYKATGMQLTVKPDVIGVPYDIWFNQTCMPSEAEILAWCKVKREAAAKPQAKKKQSATLPQNAE